MKTFKQHLNEKCWPGYKKKGTKLLFGKRYPNCVKEEEKLEEKGPGLWANIRAKRARGERMKKPGEEGAPTEAQLKSARNEEYEADDGPLTQEQLNEVADAGLAAKAEKSGISIETLRKVYRRGVAAWNSGHRPGTTPQQWGMARVNSYITKGKGTYYGADKDLHEEEIFEGDTSDLPRVKKDKESGLPKKYVAGLSDATAKARAAHWKKKDKLSDSNPSAYEPAPGDANAKTKESKHTKKYRAMFGEELNEVAAWQRKEGKSEAGGLNRKGIESYRRENPGSKLSMAVTTKPSKLKPGSKAANRRKSFCARMGGMKRRLTSAKTAKDPDSRINKALRKWNC